MIETIIEATHIGELNIGDNIIKCAVLKDGTRVLTRATFIRAIGRTGKAKGGREYDNEFKTPVFLTAKNLKPFVPKDILENSTPILFRIKSQKYIGYKAELLPEVCGIFLDAERADKLTPSQRPIAKKCDILLRGFATVGIIALVDEATGYQEIRDRLALQEILDKYLLPYKAAWAKRFPDSFYKAIFKLKGWPYDPGSVKRPSIIGTITNDIVYARLAPGVLEQLKVRTPKDEKGRRKHRFHQLLTPDIGHPKLQEHLVKAEVLMDAAPNWITFHRLLQRALPRLGETIPMDIPEE
jgi:hypothetical protein